ncbi:nicastrin [Eurytemora carolleeae]|uniref:nicastrin n=1 Tax=Eurytemora carolleeae TaxID=1294199 RepID=UPI000C76BB6F|nr:nicastrin [Eurytemora carolleeae]|eukprot:XP_023337396.1 nicastrin-like [Eurytemora affinis]
MNNENTTENLYSCFLEHNSGDDVSWPLCAVELSSPMYAAKDSETCWRRSNIANTLTPQQYCDPLSDNNIFYFTTPRNRTLPDNSTKTQSADSVILVVARLDALNIFDKEEVGFDSPSTGIVTLISAAKAVSRELRKREYKNQVENVLFLLVHGESFDYIGSTRAVYDMMSDSFPFNLTEDLKSGKMFSNGTQPLLSIENIRVIIELGQLSNRISNDVWAHTANLGSYIEDALRVLRKTVSVKTSTGKYLPPASSQSFLKERETIPVLMLTNYNQQFSNSYYHSIYDNAVVNNYNYSLGEQQAVVQHLSSLGAAVASAVVFLAAAEEIVVEKDDKFVNELLHCYTETANCSLFKEASSLNGYPWTGVVQDFPFPQYISVHTSYHTLLTTQILQYSTGEIVQDTREKDCSEETPPNLEEEKIKSVYQSCILLFLMRQSITQ